MMNLTKMMMMTMMILSTMMMSSSNNLFFSWMVMEINLISFLPILTKSKKMTDQPMKYFIMQSLSSSMMLMSILLNLTIDSPINCSVLMMTSMLMKSGMMPFHLWLPNLMQAMTWKNCLIMSTIQKIPPTIVILQTMKMNLMMTPMLLNLIMPMIAATNQLSMKKIMAYSSMTNSSWMISSIYLSKKMFSLFMIIYSTTTMMMMIKMKNMNIMFMNQMTTTNKKKMFSLTILILSMSGLPPLMGFLPKWMILQSMINISTSMSMGFIFSSIMSTFIYLNMTKMMMTKTMTKSKTKKENKSNEMDALINMIGLPMMMVWTT